MRWLTPIAGGAAVVALLLLFYSPTPYYNTEVGGYYVEGPGWYWLSAFWNYYGEVVNCTVPPQCYIYSYYYGKYIVNWWDPDCRVAQCTITHYISPQRLGNIIEGDCIGLEIHDYNVDDRQTVYVGTMTYMPGRAPPSVCIDSPETRLDCWAVAYIEHRWRGWYPPQGAITPLRRTNDAPLVIKLDVFAPSNIPYWSVTTPSGNKFAIPYMKIDPRIIPAAAPQPVLGLPNVYGWLVYVPEGCRLYIPYPASYELAVITPR